MSNQSTLQRAWRWISLQGGWLWITVAILASTAFALTWQFAVPTPTKRIVLATGGRDGAYYRWGLQYKSILEREGIRVDVRVTSGSVENIRLLRNREVDVALVQGGTADHVQASDHLASIASVDHEVLWLFAKSAEINGHLPELRGKRIAVGAQGSGTRALALRLLADADVSANNSQIVDQGGTNAATALRNGTVDAMFTVGSPQSPLVQSLLHDSELRLVPVARVPAYLRRHSFLTSVNIPRGAIDISGDVPREDSLLLATTATLVAHEDFDPGIVILLIRAAGTVHGGHGLLAEAGQFPSPLHTEIGLKIDAQNYFRDGPSFLFRYFSFSIAMLINRLKLLVIPLLTLLIPLFRLAPPIFRWRTRKSIYRWYTILRETELKATNASHDDLQHELRSLEQIEAEMLATVKVPLSYMDEFYDLRMHLALVMDRLRQRMTKKLEPVLTESGVLSP